MSNDWKPVFKNKAKKNRVEKSDLHLNLHQNRISNWNGFDQRLLDTGKDLDGLISQVQTCLHLAIIREDVSAVRLLLSAGASPNVVDDAGDTPLLLAIRSGKIELVQLLIDAKANIDYINPKSSKWHPRSTLHDAVDAGHDILKLLLEHGADPNRANSFGMSVLYKTARADYNRNSLLRLLLKYGADMDNSGTEIPTYPLEELISFNRADGVQAFLEHGYDLDNYKTKKNLCFPPLHEAVLASGEKSWGTSSITDTLSLLIDHYRAQGSLDLECVDRVGRSPLFMCIPDQTEQLKVLLEAGADPNHGDDFITPLAFTLFSDLSFRKKCIQLLVEAGADLGVSLRRLEPHDSWSRGSPHEIDADESENSSYDDDGDEFLDSVRANYVNEAYDRVIKKKAKCIVKYRVLFESKGPVKNPVEGMLRESDKMRSYYESCQDEITLLQNCSFHHSITYYTVLTDKELWRRVRSDRPYTTFDSENLNTKFPIYFADLRDRFLIAKSKHEQWELAANGLKRLMSINLDSHHLIISKILNCLKERDLRNLRHC
ncbi:hypothetical protein QAD02_000077 [Eretmocerus hayati]|uniref:Uncharacterized protein n=1 Tax=Eretmocerus hayati TaxID=131215 RepID=A0ACC2NCX9_9HYME|nr:hypothetical protein QAD02_000077 [Eretmocerus hayati]